MNDFTASDDDFHFAEMGDRWWMTETSWFSFCAPDERLGGWLYVMARPNSGVISGGAWIWDDTAYLPWEVLYSRNLSAMQLPPEAKLSAADLPTGVSIRAVKPGLIYDLAFADDERCQIALRFEGLMAPRPLRKGGSPFGGSNHFDQFGRVTGHVRLGGRTIPIDCLAARDRSWGPRPEHRPKRSAYVTGIASERDAFLAVTRWAGDTEEIAYGFMIRDGEIADLVRGRRIVERDPAMGWVNRIIIESVDQRGRPLEAVGTRISGMIINRHSFIDSNGLIAWTINGQAGHGEDQDMWPVHDWADFRRAQRQRI